MNTFYIAVKIYVICLSLVTCMEQSLKSSASDSGKGFEDYRSLDVYFSGIVTAMNGFKTYSAKPIVFNEDELFMLQQMSDNKGKYSLTDKTNAISKFKRKMQEMQCTNGVILQTVLRQSESAIDSFNGSEHKLRTMFVEIQRYLHKILCILLSAKVVAHRWLWLLYFRVYGVLGDDSDTFKSPSRDYLVEDKQLFNDISECIDLCVTHEYLDRNYIMKQNDPEMDKPVFAGWTELFRRIYDNDEIFDALYSKFTVRNVYLESLWDQDELIFEEIPSVEIDWTGARNLLNEAKHRIKSHVTDRTWVGQPFEANAYVECIVNVFIAKICLYSLMHLDALPIIRAKHSLTRFKLEIYDIFLTAYPEIIGILHHAWIGSDAEVKNICDRLEKQTSLILSKLNVKRSEWSITKSNALIKPATINENRENFEYFLGEIHKKMLPIDFTFTKFFISGNQEIEKTFIK